MVLALRECGAQGGVKFDCDFRNNTAQPVKVSTFNAKDTACLIPYEKITIPPGQHLSATALHNPAMRIGDDLRLQGIKFRVATTIPGLGKRVSDIRFTGDVSWGGANPTVDIRCDEHGRWDFS
jgi:hypothetical protein